LTFSSFNGGTAVNVTFGDGTGGTVKTLDQLNAALQADNLQATVDATGKLLITVNNDFASSTLGSVAAGGVLGGTITGALAWSTPRRRSRMLRLRPFVQSVVPVQQHPGPDHDHGAGCFVQRYQPARRRYAEADVQRNRQVDPEHHRRQFRCAGLGSPTSPTASTLSTTPHQQDHCQPYRRRQLAAVGSLRSRLELSIVQIRQDFSKNLINVLQTGSSNLTLADTNEEAANSQALSTRQSIAVSALSLANQSQQAVLQLLR